MADLPPAPDDLSEREQQAWRRGFAAAGYVLANHASTLAGAMEGQDLDDDNDAPAGADADDGDAEHEACPECGADRIDAFGGPVCPNGCDSR